MRRDLRGLQHRPEGDDENALLGGVHEGLQLGGQGYGGSALHGLCLLLY